MRFPGVIAPISGLMGHKPSSRGCAFQAVKQDGSALQLIAEVSPWPVCDIFFGRIRKDPVDDLVVNQNLVLCHFGLEQKLRHSLEKFVSRGFHC